MASESRSESEPPGTALQIGDATFIGEPSRIDASGVIKSLMHAGTLLHVGRCLIDRGHDCPSCRIRRLSGVNGSSREPVRFLHRYLIRFCAGDGSGDQRV